MKPLSRESRALLEAVQGREEPSVADKQRIRSKLSARMGAGLAMGTAVTAGAAVAEAAKSSAFAAVTAWLPATAKVLSVVAIAGGVTVGALRVSQRGAATATSARAVVSQPSASERASQRSQHDAPAESVGSPALADTAHAGEPVSEQLASGPSTASAVTKRGALSATAPLRSVSTPVVPPVAAPALPTQDGLATQIVAIRDARAAIRRGDGAAALLALNRASVVAQTGSLAQEVLLARVSALCLVGDVGAARRTADQFLSSFPTSPLAASVRGSCAFPSTEQSTR